jgi:hypothetical protein
METLTVGNSLSVTGRTTLSELGVTGDITAGILSINGLEGTINSVGEPLRLQNLGVAGIDILDGKVTIDTAGNITAKGSLTLKKLKIDESEALAKSLGDVVIEAGETYVDVTTASLTTKSRIFVTAEDPAAIGSKRINATTFRIRLEKPLPQDLRVNWWVIN